MKTKSDTRKRKQINEKRLAAYTAAAGAALLAAAPADAAVQYSGVVDVTLAASMRNYPCRSGGYFHYGCASQSGASSFIDIDGNGTDDLKFGNNPTFNGAFSGYMPGSHPVGVSWYLAGGFSNLNGVSFAGGGGSPVQPERRIDH